MSNPHFSPRCRGYDEYISVGDTFYISLRFLRANLFSRVSLLSLPHTRTFLSDTFIRHNGRRRITNHGRKRGRNLEEDRRDQGFQPGKPLHQVPHQSASVHTPCHAYFNSWIFCHLFQLTLIPLPLSRFYLTLQEYYESLSPEDRATFERCVRTGIDNADSGLGCYAMKPADYSTFAPFFDQVRFPSLL